MPHPAPHSRPRPHSRRLPLDSLRRRFRHARPLRSCGQHQISGFPAISHLCPPHRARPLRRTLQPFGARRRSPQNHRNRKRRPEVLLRSASRARIHPAGAFLISECSPNVGRLQSLSLFRVRLPDLEARRYPLSSAARHTLRPRLPVGVALLRSRTTLRPATPLHHRRLSRLPIEPRVARRHRSRIPRIQAPVPGRHPVRLARRARLENPRRSCHLRCCAARTHLPLFRPRGHARLLHHATSQCPPSGLYRTQPFCHPDAFSLQLLRASHSVAARLMDPLSSVLIYRHRARSPDLEVFAPTLAPLLCPDSGCRARQSTHLHLRSVGADARISPPRWLVDSKPRTSSHSAPARSLISCVPSAFLRPTCALDPPPTLRSHLRRVAVDHLSHSHPCSPLAFHEPRVI